MSSARTRYHLLTACAALALASCGGGGGGAGSSATPVPVVVVPAPSPTPTPTLPPASSGPTVTPTPAPTASDGAIVIVTPTPAPSATPAPTSTPTQSSGSGSGEIIVVTPTPSPAATPAPLPSASAPATDQPAGGFSYLAGLVTDLGNTIIDAFWRFLALFTADGGSTPWSTGLTGFRAPVLSAAGAAAIPPDVVRLARQATFGPTPQVVSRIAELGIPGWIDEQFTLRGSTYKDLIEWVPAEFCTNNTAVPKCASIHFSRNRVAARFYADATMAPDQLRQRVAFALSQILVVSNGGDATAGLASYEQLLLDNAFGNYGDLLYNVTLHGFMGRYLSMADSSRIAPSENYARELLQLFSSGPVQLNADGTPRLDATGATMPAYTPDDIRGIARALTGWTYAKSGGRSDWTGNDLSLPMVPAGANRYDSDTKTFLTTTVPAGATPADSVRIVATAAFNHSSTPPRLAKLLIQHLVKSNPTSAYVGRIAAVFADNGSGVRGDLRAVVRAILLDPEARGDEPRGADAGKVKEPVLVMTGVARAIGLATDGVAFVQRDANLGQPVFGAPSVFNFYPADYPLAGQPALVSPASKLLSAGNATWIHNLVYNWTILGEANRGEWNFDMGLPRFTGSQPNWQGWEAISDDPDRLVAMVNLLLLNNSANDAQRGALRSAILSVRNSNATVQAHKRAQVALYIAASSPNFLVDR